MNRKLNYFAFTATKANSFSVSTMTTKEVGDSYLHSIHGKGIVVDVQPSALGTRILVRTDITVDQLIEVL